MKIINTTINDVKIVQPKVYGDHRGFFLESFQKERYAEFIDPGLEFVQDNHSRSTQGVLRGLHFQRSRPQGKLVRCVRGEVFDVVVDIRQQSPTYGQWVGATLSEENMNQLWCPPGLAHGFLVLSELADVEYKCTDYYDPTDEGCLIYNDPSIGIGWPSVEGELLLSAKDLLGVKLAKLGNEGK